MVRFAGDPERRVVVRLSLHALLAMTLVLGACRAPSVTTSEPARLDLELPPPSALGQQGVALGMYFVDPDRSYASYLWEVANTGADHVSLVVAWSQPDVHTASIRPTPERSVSDADLRATIAAARSLGLRVMLFPIVWVEHRDPGDWRGRIEPDDLAAWWAEYDAFVLHYATLAAGEGVDLLSIGSELGSMEQHESQWRDLIRRVRGTYEGQLVYSANWDHYMRTPFWDAVDYIGVTGYHELTDVEDHIPAVGEIEQAWEPVVRDLTSLADVYGRSVVITELGYVSQRGAARRPWDYTRSGSVDLDAQYDLYRGTYRAWHDEPRLQGVYFWNWFGAGGASDNGYSPRNKPAEQVVRFWYGGELSGVP